MSILFGASFALLALCGVLCGVLLRGRDLLIWMGKLRETLVFGGALKLSVSELVGSWVWLGYPVVFELGDGVRV